MSAHQQREADLRIQIARRIQQSPQQRISFAEYMDQVLYDPDLGYYASQVTQIGAAGDYVTSSTLSSDFAQLLATQFQQLWTVLDRPVPFCLVEMGAGQGILAADLLNHVQDRYPEFWQALQYGIIERSPALIQLQHTRLDSIPAPPHGVQWLTWDQIPSHSITGCFFSNELVDAFPVHRVQIQDRHLHEIYVTLADPKPSEGSQTKASETEGSQVIRSQIKESQTKESQTKGFQTKGFQTEGFQTKASQTQKSQTKGSQTIRSQAEESQTKVSQIEASQTEGSQDLECPQVEDLPQFQDTLADPSDPRLLSYLQDLGISIDSEAYPDGYRSEINLAAIDWIQTVADRLQRGYVLTIDYGYPAQRYYHPSRSQGTLLCYRRHLSGDTPYQALGQQDLTTHVNFTALEYYGHQAGLISIGFTDQTQFLSKLGLLDRLAHLNDRDPVSITEILQRRQALHFLIDPLGLGGFGVLIQAKGLTAAEAKIPLEGFRSIE